MLLVAKPCKMAGVRKRRGFRWGQMWRGDQLEAGTEEDLLRERLQLRVQTEGLWTSKETVFTQPSHLRILPMSVACIEISHFKNLHFIEKVRFINT